MTRSGKGKMEHKIVGNVWNKEKFEIKRKKHRKTKEENSTKRKP